MAIPKLSKKDQKSLEVLKDLDNNDLYAILGAEPMYYQPSPSPDALLIGLRFEKTKQTIAKGKKKWRQLIEIIRDPICKKWTQVKKEYNAKIEKGIIVALIIEVIRPYFSNDPHGMPPIVVIAELTWRLSRHSLDKFCAQSK